MHWCWSNGRCWAIRSCRIWVRRLWNICGCRDILDRFRPPLGESCGDPLCNTGRESQSGRHGSNCDTTNDGAGCVRCSIDRDSPLDLHFPDTITCDPPALPLRFGLHQQELVFRSGDARGAKGISVQESHAHTLRMSYTLTFAATRRFVTREVAPRTRDPTNASDCKISLDRLHKSCASWDNL